MLGKAPASAKAKLGKAKTSKNAGKLGKVGKKEVLGKGKRMLAPRISDVSLDPEGQDVDLFKDLGLMRP